MAMQTSTDQLFGQLGSALYLANLSQILTTKRCHMCAGMMPRGTHEWRGFQIF